jgi:ABC-type multidrug transport system permease subunit
MIRAVLLAISKEFRLLRRDPVGLFMLIVAPIAVIAAAGFSLSSVYGGGSSSHAVAVVNEDDGEISGAIVDGLQSKRSIVVLHVDNRDLARAMVRERKQAVVAIIIPAGTTAAFERGASVRVIVYADPVRYLETVNVELELARLGRRINQAANDRARQALTEARGRLEQQIAEANHGADQVRAAIAQYARTAQHSRAELDAQIRQQLEKSVASARAQTEVALNSAITELSSQAHSQLASQRALLGQIGEYLERLRTTRLAFEKWFADLQNLAGSRASGIPAPPAFPEPPRDLLTIAHSEPTAPDFGALRTRLEKSIATPDLNVHIPELAVPPLPAIPALPTQATKVSATVPGTIAFAAEDSSGAEISPLSGFNAFDLQVPGFAVTFLLIGMLMGVSLALIDERDWGTLDRLRAAAAPLGATFAGKLLARFVIGFVQMAVLFAAGWFFFGISLGRAPLALVVPSAAIAFAGAAFGLVVAGVGRTRDAVLPVGAIVIMTMAAVGGCWWPIDLEPQWMQTAALVVPTTWAMRAFNDLMIRGLSASSALVPSAVNLAFGFLYMIVGIAISRRRFAP